MPAERRRRVRPLLPALLVALAGLGCAVLDHHLQADRYMGRPLSTRSGAGAERLASEIRIDPTIAEYVAEHGRPDYLYLASHTKIYIFYLASDGAALFERPLIAQSRLTELGRIPGSLLDLLPRAERERLLARRSRTARSAQSKARAARRRMARNAPAARAPGGSTLSHFPAAQIVERMRPPLTAADPGVSGWHDARLRSGGRVYTAKVGGTRYEVRSDRVAFTVPLSSASRHLPTSARLAIQRVNNAIFGARSKAVTDLMVGLAERAAADRSGRTQFARRVSGRTIRVGRNVGSGVLAYSVHP